MDSISQPDVFKLMFGARLLYLMNGKFYFKFVNDDFRPDYFILAFVRYSDDYTVGYINSAGQLTIDFGILNTRDYDIVFRMIRSIVPIYKPLLKKDDYE